MRAPIYSNIVLKLANPFINFGRSMIIAAES